MPLLILQVGPVGVFLLVSLLSFVQLITYVQACGSTAQPNFVILQARETARGEKTKSSKKASTKGKKSKK